MLREASKLIGGGALSEKDYRRTADILFDFGTLSAPPEGARNPEPAARAQLAE